jgi:hypothetical protein
MHKKNKHLVLLLGGFFLFSNHLSASSRTERDILSEMKEKYIMALQGSGSSAMEIASELYRWIPPPAVGAHPAEYWVQIAAENGSRTAQHLLAQIIWRKYKSGESYRIRAKFWARRSAAQDDFQPALDLLKIFDADEKAMRFEKNK